MIGGVDLHSRANLCSVTNSHLNYIENDAVEIEERASTDADVEAIIAEERRPDFRALADAT